MKKRKKEKRIRQKGTDDYVLLVDVFKNKMVDWTKNKKEKEKNQLKLLLKIYLHYGIVAFAIA